MNIFFTRAIFFFSFIMFMGSTYLAAFGGGVLVELALLSVNSVCLGFPVLLDFMSCTFLGVVLAISSCVLYFSGLYMESEGFIARLNNLLLLLIMSMGFLILVPSILALVLGWDGLGLISFALVTLYSSKKALGAGMFTGVTNRVGDAFMLVSIGFFLEMGSSFSLVCLQNQPITCILVAVAAMTKSAQFPFSSWLPAAMEAPTPVSALVHSSTLVTAGVYVMIRFYPVLSSWEGFQSLILFLGGVTSLLAGLSANLESDLKKIVALSTLSQLGFMVVCIGVGAPLLAFFHMLMHAALKALLFICVGTLIHLHNHSQNLNYFGGCFINLPFTSACMVVSVSSMTATPFLSGFYSKEAVIDTLLYSPHSLISILMVMFSVIMTNFYCGRIFFSSCFCCSKTLPVTRLKEPFFLVGCILSLFSVLLGAAITSLVSPICLEPMNPVYKVVVWSIFLFAMSSNLFSSPGTSKAMHGTSLLNTSASNLLYLTPISTQEMLKLGNLVSSKLCYSDKSWVEMPQVYFWDFKDIEPVPAQIGFGIVVILFFLVLFALMVS